MRTRGLALALAAALLAAAVAGAADTTVAVERFLARLPRGAIQDLSIEQDLVVFNPEGRAPQASGHQRVLFRMPARQRIEQTVDGRAEIRLTVGGEAWRRGADGVTVAVPAARDTHGVALVIPTRRSADELFAEWRALGVRTDRAHEARLGGRPVTVVGAHAGERDVPAVWIDDEYGVVRFVTREAGPTGPVTTDLTFSEHRLVSGALFFPYRHEIFRAGKLVVRILVRSVVVNSGLPDALFDPVALRAGR